MKLRYCRLAKGKTVSVECSPEACRAGSTVDTPSLIYIVQYYAVVLTVFNKASNWQIVAHLKTI